MPKTATATDSVFSSLPNESENLEAEELKSSRNKFLAERSVRASKWSIPVVFCCFLLRITET